MEYGPNGRTSLIRGSESAILADLIKRAFCIPVVGGAEV